MEKRKKWNSLKGLLIFGYLVTGAFAAVPYFTAYSSERCDAKCKEWSGFTRDRTYVYSYQTETSTFLQQEGTDYSNLTISCRVQLEILGICDIVLLIDKVAITETDRDGREITSPNESEFAAQLSSEMLRFGMQGGIVTSVCPSYDEPVWVTNFKRGILSALQRTMPSTVPGTETITETTVAGSCPTVVRADATTIHKTKDFAECEGHFHVHGLVPGIKLASYAPFIDAISSSQSCQQEYTDKCITRSVCEERHSLVPISGLPAGPVTTVRQTLTSERTKGGISGNAASQIGRKSTIRFDHSGRMTSQKRDSADASDIVSQLCQSLRGGVGPRTAQLFPSLIHEMRRLETTVLASVITDAECGDYHNTLRQLLIDALEQCQSNGCIEVMVNWITEGVLTSQGRIQKWIISLNFVENPTKEMVSLLNRLTNFESIRKPLLLAMSSIINKYCTTNLDCLGDPRISGAINYFEGLLGFPKCRYRTKEEKRMMMVALHAIGNAGLPRRSLLECYESELTDPALRLAAMEAVQQMPCTAGRQEELARIMEETSQDSELRISAYKALMACPTQELLDRIEALLGDEKTDQVGAYIVGSLKNLMNSNDPLRKEQKDLIRNHEIRAILLDEPVKFPWNAEWSWYNENSGYGLNGEGDVVFSTNSFIPRQVSLKGGFDAFGYAFQALEFGGRVDGVNPESILNWILGPGTEQDSTRQRRSLAGDDKSNQGRGINDFEVPQDSDIDGHIYIKIFGQEVAFMDTEDIKAMFEQADSINILEELAQLAAGKTYEVTKNEMFLERMMSVPLVNGLEMKVSINASMVQRLNVTGKLDVTNPGRLEIDGTIEPSFAVDLSSLVEVDAHCTRTGVRYLLSAHSATSLGGRLTLEVHDFRLKLRAPEHKQEFVTVSSKVEFIHQEQFDTAPGPTEMELVSENVCTQESLEGVIGLQLCRESCYYRRNDSSVTRPLFSGPYKFSLYVQKVEMDMTSLDLEASYNFDDSQEAGFHLSVGTPGTVQERRCGWDGHFNRETKVLGIALFCSHHRSQMIAVAERSENSAGVQVRWLTIQSEYAAHFTYQRYGRSYRVRAGMSTPDFPNIALEGSFIHAFYQLSLDFSLHMWNRCVVTLNGAIAGTRYGRASIHYTSTLFVGGDNVNGLISSSMKIQEEGWNLEATLAAVGQTLQISAEHIWNSEEGTSHNFFISCGINHHPNLSFSLEGYTEQTVGASSGNLRLCLRDTTCNRDQRELPVGDLHHLNFNVNEAEGTGMAEFGVYGVNNDKMLFARVAGATNPFGHPGSVTVFFPHLFRSNLSISYGMDRDALGLKFISHDLFFPQNDSPVGDILLNFNVDRTEGTGVTEFGVYGVDNDEMLFVRVTGATRSFGLPGNVTVFSTCLFPSNFSISFDMDRDGPDNLNFTLSLASDDPDIDEVFCLSIQEKNFRVPGYKTSTQGRLVTAGLFEGSKGSAESTELGKASYHRKNGFHVVQVNRTTRDNRTVPLLELEGSGLASCWVKLHLLQFSMMDFSVWSTDSWYRILVGFNVTTEDQQAVLAFNHSTGGLQSISAVSFYAASFGFDTYVNFDQLAASFGFDTHLHSEINFDFELLVRVELTHRPMNSLVVLRVTDMWPPRATTMGVSWNSTGLYCHSPYSTDGVGADRLVNTTLGPTTDIVPAGISELLKAVPAVAGFYVENIPWGDTLVVFVDGGEPLLHLNITYEWRWSPSTISRNTTVSVRLPTVAVPGLRHFGLHFQAEEAREIPTGSHSLLLFWGSSAGHHEHYELSITSVPHSQGGSGVGEGSLLVVQPLPRLPPEYLFHYVITPRDSGFQFHVTYMDDNQDSSELDVAYYKQEQQDGPTLYVTTIETNLPQEKSLSFRSNLNHLGTERISGIILLTVDDGDQHEEAELGIDVKNGFGDGMNCSASLTFTHSSSSSNISCSTNVQTNDQLSHAGFRGTCDLRNRAGPVNVGIIASINGGSAHASVHAEGRGNDVTLRGVVRDISNGSTSTGYQLRTDNSVNGYDANANLLYHEGSLDISLETNGDEQTYNIGLGQGVFDPGYHPQDEN